MKYEEFLKLVRAMRKAQIQYFLSRSRDALIDAKRLERQVDDVLRSLDLAGSSQRPTDKPLHKDWKERNNEQ
jgi:hypothetical protein